MAADPLRLVSLRGTAQVQSLPLFVPVRTGPSIICRAVYYLYTSGPRDACAVGQLSFDGRCERNGFKRAVADPLRLVSLRGTAQV